MLRSKEGLMSAGEWPASQKLLPDFRAKAVLDLSCGYGWHCRYAVEHGAASALGTDISHKMLEEAKREAIFLGEPVVKYHRTLTTYISLMIQNGFDIQAIVEPQPTEEMMALPGIKDEMRRPMMLLVSGCKK